MAKEITTNELAEIVKKGFDQTATKADLKALRENTDERFKSVDENLNALREHVDHRIDGLELKLTAYVGSWAKDFEKLHDWVKGIDERLTAVEKTKR